MREVNDKWCLKINSKLTDFFRLVRPGTPRIDGINRISGRRKNRIGSCYKCKTSLGKGEFVFCDDGESKPHAYVVCPCCGYKNLVAWL